MDVLEQRNCRGGNIMANIKNCFSSRWGEEGRIIEADFSQLEVIGAALISGDKMMKQDIIDGIDSHSQSASWLNPYSYEDIRAGYLAGDKYFEKMRKNAKAPRFELQYGAGAKSIAENNNISEEKAAGFINKYYNRYHELAAFQQSVADAVESGVRPCGMHSQYTGVPLTQGEYVSVTGRRYVFISQDSPAWMRRKGQLTSFSPTQMKNYPMQGFATGDIVPEMLGYVHRQLQAYPILRSRCLPINTIHDAIIFDCHVDMLNTSCELIKLWMEDVPKRMKERFGLELDLPFHTDVEVGINWNEMEAWKP